MSIDYLKGKRLYVFLIFTLQFSAFNHSFAQRFNAGVTGGLIVSDVSGSDPIDHDNDFLKVGYELGGFVNRKISEKNDLQLEINFIQKGTLQTPDSNNVGYFKMALNYIEVPIIYKHHLNLSFSKTRTSAFDIHAGLSVGQLVHSVLEGDSVSPNPDMGFLNKTDVSILVGIDYNFSDHFNFCLRYSNSVIPAIKKESTPSGYYLPYSQTFNYGNNMVWHFVFQYAFGKSVNKKSEEGNE